MRYLLPITYALLQQLPGALLRMADLQMLLAQKGAAALQLLLSNIPGYAPLLQQTSMPAAAAGVSHTPGASSSSSSIPSPADATMQLRTLTSLQFEVQLSSDTPGWLKPKYLLYLNDQHTPGATCGSQQAGDNLHSNAGVAGSVRTPVWQPGVRGVLAGVSGSKAVLQPSHSSHDGSMSSRAFQPGRTSLSEDSSDEDEDEDEDEAVLTMMELLPERWESNSMIVGGGLHRCLEPFHIHADLILP